MSREGGLSGTKPATRTSGTIWDSVSLSPLPEGVYHREHRPHNWRTGALGSAFKQAVHWNKSSKQPIRVGATQRHCSLPHVRTQKMYCKTIHQGRRPTWKGSRATRPSIKVTSQRGKADLQPDPPLPQRDDGSRSLTIPLPKAGYYLYAVSYTHLTLPTILRV